MTDIAPTPETAQAPGKTVEFFFDYGSPASYLAWTQLGRVTSAHGARVVYRPVVLGALFKATGNRPPIAVPAKGVHLVKDLERWARLWHVPFVLNPNFPIDTVRLMKVAQGVLAQQPERFEDFSRAIYDALWVKPENLNDPTVVESVLAQAGFEPAATLALAEDESVRAGIRANTEEAVKRGAFGAPTFFVGSEMFWGQDRMFMVEEALAAG